MLALYGLQDAATPDVFWTGWHTSSKETGTGRRSFVDWLQLLGARGFLLRCGEPFCKGSATITHGSVDNDLMHALQTVFNRGLLEFRE